MPILVVSIVETLAIYIMPVFNQNQPYFRYFTHIIRFILFFSKPNGEDVDQNVESKANASQKIKEVQVGKTVGENRNESNKNEFYSLSLMIWCHYHF